MTANAGAGLEMLDSQRLESIMRDWRWWRYPAVSAYRPLVAGDGPVGIITGFVQGKDMKHPCALAVVIAGICAASRLADEPRNRVGELALIEIVSWGASTFEPGDAYHTGFLHAKTVETKGNMLPSQFKLSFKRSVSSEAAATPWNNLPAGSTGRLRIHNGDWIVGRFIQLGERWRVVPGGKEFTLSRPEDMPDERLQLVQAYFTTPLVRVWIPTDDVLADTLDRIRWGMTETEFIRAFTDASIAKGEWQLTRHSFRKTIVVRHPQHRDLVRILWNRRRQVY